MVEASNFRRSGSLPAMQRADREAQGSGMFGIRRWVQRTVVGGDLDDESPVKARGSARSADGSSMAQESSVMAEATHDLTQDLALARTLSDKFLILCLLDEKLRHFYTGDSASLSVVKSSLSEGFVAAMRGVAIADGPKLSLNAHRDLTQVQFDQLNKHLETVILEHCEESKSTFPFQSAEDFVHALSTAPTMPYSLLPRGDSSVEVQTAAMGLKNKGGEDSKVRVLPGGLELAPLHVPMRRRRQMLACVVGTSLIPGAAVLTGLCFYFWRKTWPVLVPYLTWAWIIDKSPWKGGMRISNWLRNVWMFRHWAEYFPATLIKANPRADFSGKRPILMGYHPHGILSFGVQLCISSDAAGWPEKFPNLSPRPCTLNMNFMMPFLREFVGRLGGIPADAKAIRSALKPGNAVVLVVGGAAEALDTKPGEYVLTLARRTGFFRLALQHGADLVPCFGFGENDIFETVKPSSLVRKIQLKAYKLMSFSMPLFYGRGVFTYNMGMLPFRRPLTVVVGDPILTEKTAEPTKEQIDELKEKYIAALRQLHKDWAPRLEPGRDSTLMIL
mmetsp:Transcript_82607/g.181633  ORF Transcript_82607/g.181633 Transcript_82607/m.181633 type:complete len:560 (+) Transcript_82607:140-1819(+)